MPQPWQAKLDSNMFKVLLSQHHQKLEQGSHRCEQEQKKYEDTMSKNNGRVLGSGAGSRCLGSGAVGLGCAEPENGKHE